MDGKEVAKIVQKILTERGIPKSKFYKESGVSSATMSQWRNGVYDPTQEMLKRIENYLDISFDDYEKEDTDENWELLQLMRERPEMRNLLHSARNLPTSSIYLLIAQVEKEKESGTSY